MKQSTDLSRWAWDGNVLRHYPHGDTEFHDYEILAEKLRTGKQLADWILHLGAKNWVTKDDLIQVTARFQERHRGN